MNNFGIIYPKSYNELIELISEEEIYNYYFNEINICYNDIEIGRFYSSPFLDRNDRKPSFRLDHYDDKIVWRDFGISKKPKNSINFVEKLYNINHFEAIEKIFNDVYLNNNLNNNIIHKVIENKNKKIIPAGCKYYDLKHAKSIEYWDKIKLTNAEIKFYNIYEGKVVYNSNLIFETSEKYPIFIYIFDINLKIWKAYNPYYEFNKKIKFFSNNITDHIQNYNNIGLYKSNILFITKSYKDCITLNKIKYDAIAPHSENSFINDQIFYYLLSVYDYVVILYGNDERGIETSTNFSNQYNIPNLILPHMELNNNLINDPFAIVENTNGDYKLLNDIIDNELINLKI